MKKYLMGFIAVVLAIGFSAFNSEPAKKAPLSGEVWFVFNGTPAETGDETKYSIDGSGSAPTVCPTDVSSAYRCEIFAVPTGSPAVPILATQNGERKKSAP